MEPPSRRPLRSAPLQRSPHSPAPSARPARPAHSRQRAGVAAPASLLSHFFQPSPPGHGGLLGRRRGRRPGRDDPARLSVCLDPTTTVCVPDLRTMCNLPADVETDGVATFRALLLPKGQDCARAGPTRLLRPTWLQTSFASTQQLALSKVHFAASTRREPELLLGFSAFGVRFSTQMRLAPSPSRWCCR